MLMIKAEYKFEKKFVESEICYAFCLQNLLCVIYYENKIYLLLSMVRIINVKWNFSQVTFLHLNGRFIVAWILNSNYAQ